MRASSPSLGGLFGSFRLSDRQTDRQTDKQAYKQTDVPKDKKRRMSLSIGSASLTGGTLRGKGKEVKRSLANIWEIKEEEPESRGALEEVAEEPAVGVKQLGKLLEQQLSRTERQDGFSYFAGDKPKLEEEREGGGEEQAGPSHQDTYPILSDQTNSPAPYSPLSGTTSPDDSYEDLLRSLTPVSHVTTRRRRSSSSSPAPLLSEGSVTHSLDQFLGESEVPAVGVIGSEADVETVELVETVDIGGFFDPYEDDMFRVSTVSTLSSVSDDEYVLFKAHEEEEEEEEWQFS